MNSSNNIQLLSKLRNFVCHHDDFTKALEGINECMLISKANNDPIGSLLIGAGGVGKSTVSKVLKSKNRPFAIIEDNCEKLIIPVFYVPVPSPITIKSLTIRMLEELGCTDHQGTSEHLNYRLRVLLKNSKTQLIMLDEFHHIYSSSAEKSKSSENVANWIKTLADETKISICLIGLSNIHERLYIDSQLARRFSHVFTLNPLTLEHKNKNGTLIPFLNQVSKYLNTNFGITFEPELTSNDLSRRIFLATSGFQAYVMQLIHQSCISALNKKRFTINMEDFHEAYALKSIIYKPLTQQNIFQLTPAQVINILG